MSLELHYAVSLKTDLADNTEIGDTTKLANSKSGTINGANTTSAQRPKVKAPRTNAKLNSLSASLLCDGNDSLSLSTPVNITAQDYTLACCWVDGDYTADTWLFTGSTNDAHYGIDAGGAGVLIKPNSSRSPQGDEVTIATNNTHNGTVSYTFGSDVEALIIVNDYSTNTVSFYNIAGDKIAEDTSSLYSSNIVFNQIIGNGANNGLNGSILDIRIHKNFAAGSSYVSALARSYVLQTNRTAV
tara:strand:- start:2755 stop:3483 length:729 start_codon:yes stop_codon:yes gene_type:complete